MTHDWLTDARGNRASIEWFGSQEAAQRALEGLENCDNCTNCSGCSDCSRCSGCSGCSDCSRCSRCSGCSGCSDCSHLAMAYSKRDIQALPDADVPGVPPVPVIENIDAKVLEAVTATPELFNMSVWHEERSCGTAHCRAGWVVHLAGEAGYALEKFHDTALAAQLIYAASGAPINPCRFYDSSEDALADMKARVEKKSAA